MSSEISKLSVHLSANAAGLVGGMKQGEHALEHFGEVAEHVNGILEKLPEILTAAGLGFEAFEAFKTAGDNEQSMAKLSAVVKSTGEAAGFSSQELGKMAEEISEVTTFEKSAVVGAEAILATFTSIKGDQFKDAIKAATDLATVLDGDLKGATLQIGKALNDPIEGITALKRAGVSFTEQQVEQIKTMQEAGNIIGAQKVVLEELKHEFEGAAEAVGNTFTGQMKIAKNAIEEAAADIASGFLPALATMAKWLKEAATWAKEHHEALKAIGENILKIITAIVAYKTAMAAITAAQKAWNLIQAATLALQGPKGWLQLAAAAGVYLAAQWAINAMSESANTEMAKANEHVEKLKAGMEGVGAAGDTMAEGFEKVAKKAKDVAKDVANLTEKLKEQVATFGMTSHQAEIYKIKQEGKALGQVFHSKEEGLAFGKKFDASLKEAEEAAKQLDALDAQKKATEAAEKAWVNMENEAQKWIDDSREPWEKLEDQLQRINELEKSHLLTAEQAAKASAKAADEAYKAEHHKKEKPFEPHNFGNEKTAAFERRFTQGFQANATPVWEKMYKEQIENNKRAAEIARNTKKMADARVDVVKI